MAPRARRGIQAIPVFLVFVAILTGFAGVCAPGRTALAQDAGIQPQRLDRTGLRPTLAEDFTHFAASASGVVDGRPAWRTTFFDGGRTLTNNHEVEWYEDSGPDGPFRVIHGGLEIRAAPAAGLPQGMTHRSGMITSEHLLNQRYGYFEMRAQLPRGKGLWPAFWLLPSDGGWPPEIDVMEMLGHAPETYYASLHARTDGQPPLDEVTAVAAPDLSAGFHVFGVSWRPEHVRFYLDDVLVHESVTPPSMHRPMFLLANLAVGGAGSWPGQAGAATAGTFRIAWIRAWQFGDLGAAGP
jgi:beta-glucanase (GH16 family)